MKYLIYAGIAPGANPTVNELLTKKVDAGGNVGNLLFINAVAQSLCVNGDEIYSITHYRAEFSDLDIEKINSEYDAFILPLADAFRDDNISQLEKLTVTVKKLRIPCVVIGVGLRAEYDADLSIPRKFDDAVKYFVEAVLEKSSCISIRGQVTGNYLKRLGFAEDRDYMVIGCPSMCMAATHTGINIRNVEKITNLAINGNDLAPENVIAMIRKAITDHPNAYVIQQRESEMADVFLGRFSDYAGNAFRVPGSLYGKELYSKLVKENKIRYFSNIYRWVEFLQGMDFCLNSRFHGTVVSLMAGTPSIIIPIDSRMQEMVEYHKLPSIPAKEIKITDTVEALISKVNLKAPEKVAEQNLNRYYSLLERNSLSHVDKDYILNYRIFGGRQELSWKMAEKSYSEISSVCKFGRVSRYYIDKYKNKIINKLSSF